MLKGIVIPPIVSCPACFQPPAHTPVTSQVIQHANNLGTNVAITLFVIVTFAAVIGICYMAFKDWE